MERSTVRLPSASAPSRGSTLFGCPLLGERGERSAPENASAHELRRRPQSRDRGLDAPEVTVEVHLANGLPSFTLVGLADTEVKESRERVRAALQTSGLEFPHNQRITVNLAPADLPKESGRFDLPIALGILAASGQIDAGALDALRVRRRALARRRAAAGARRPGDGARAAAHGQPAPRTLVLPQASADEAALVDGLAIRGADHLLDVVRGLLARRRRRRDRPACAAAAAARRAADLPT